MAFAGNRTEAFKARFSGRVLTVGHTDYDRIACDLERRDRSEAPLSLRVAPRLNRSRRLSVSRRASGLEVAVRGGGHNYAGHAVCDAAHDPSRCDERRHGRSGDATRRVWRRRDVGRRRCRHAATRLGDAGWLYQPHGHRRTDTRGGIGWLTKKAGLSCDNLVAAEVVTADSRVVRASHEEHPDLFWALRGGGGNFGIVTWFESPFTRGPAGQPWVFFFGLDNGSAALRFARDFIETLSLEATGFLGIGLSAPPAPFVPQEHPFPAGACAARRRLRIG